MVGNAACDWPNFFIARAFLFSISLQYKEMLIANKQDERSLDKKHRKVYRLI